MASAAQVHSRLVAVEARNLSTAAFVRYPRGKGEGAVLRDMSSWRWCRIRVVLRSWCGCVSSCPAFFGEVLLLAVALAHAQLVPIRSISSPMSMSPLVRRSAPVLLLGKWSHLAGPGIVLLMLRMPPLLWLRISPLLLLPLGRLLLMVLWALLLP